MALLGDLSAFSCSALSSSSSRLVFFFGSLHPLVLFSSFRLRRSLCVLSRSVFILLFFLLSSSISRSSASRRLRLHSSSSSFSSLAPPLHPPHFSSSCLDAQSSSSSFPSSREASSLSSLLFKETDRRERWGRNQNEKKEKTGEALETRGEWNGMSTDNGRSSISGRTTHQRIGTGRGRGRRRSARKKVSSSPSALPPSHRPRVSNSSSSFSSSSLSPGSSSSSRESSSVSRNCLFFLASLPGCMSPWETSCQSSFATPPSSSLFFFFCSPLASVCAPSRKDKLRGLSQKLGFLRLLSPYRLRLHQHASTSLSSSLSSPPPPPLLFGRSSLARCASSSRAEKGGVSSSFSLASHQALQGRERSSMLVRNKTRDTERTALRSTDKAGEGQGEGREEEAEEERDSDGKNRVKQSRRGSVSSKEEEKKRKEKLKETPGRISPRDFSSLSVAASAGVSTGVAEDEEEEREEGEGEEEGEEETVEEVRPCEPEEAEEGGDLSSPSLQVSPAAGESLRIFSDLFNLSSSSSFNSTSAMATELRQQPSPPFFSSSSSPPRDFPSSASFFPSTRYAEWYLLRDFKPSPPPLMQTADPTPRSPAPPSQRQHAPLQESQSFNQTAHAPPSSSSRRPSSASSASSLPFSSATLRDLNPFRSTKTQRSSLRPESADSLTPWKRIVSSKFVETATDTFLPLHRSFDISRLAEDLAYDTAEMGVDLPLLRKAVAAAVVDAELWRDRKLREKEEEEEGEADEEEGKKKRSAGVDPVRREILRRKIEREVVRQMRVLFEGGGGGGGGSDRHEEEEEEDFGTDEKFNRLWLSTDSFEDISAEPRFVPDDWTDVPRPCRNSTAITTLTASHMTRPLIDTADPCQRNKLRLQYLSPKEKKRQAFWQSLLALGRLSCQSRLVSARAWLTEAHERQQEEAYKNRRQLLELAALRERRRRTSLQKGIERLEAPPYPLPLHYLYVNHRLYNSFKLLNVIGHDACLDLPTPHSRLEAFRHDFNLRSFYLLPVDDRVSLHAKIAPRKGARKPHGRVLLSSPSSSSPQGEKKVDKDGCGASLSSKLSASAKPLLGHQESVENLHQTSGGKPSSPVYDISFPIDAKLLAYLSNSTASGQAASVSDPPSISSSSSSSGSPPSGDERGNPVQVFTYETTLGDFLLPDMDAVIVMRDGVIDPRLSINLEKFGGVEGAEEEVEGGGFLERKTRETDELDRDEGGESAEAGRGEVGGCCGGGGRNQKCGSESGTRKNDDENSLGPETSATDRERMSRCMHSGAEEATVEGERTEGDEREGEAKAEERGREEEERFGSSSHGGREREGGAFSSSCPPSASSCAGGGSEEAPHHPHHGGGEGGGGEEEEQEMNGEEEEAYVGSFMNIRHPLLREVVAKELQFVPEYSNYWRTNTQPFHRGQIGKTSRKYDSDFPIYDYRKLDFGMAKFSALNLACMHDAACVVVGDDPKSSEEEKEEEKVNEAKKAQGAMMLEALSLGGREGGGGREGEKGREEKEKEEKKKGESRRREQNRTREARSDEENAPGERRQSDKKTTKKTEKNKKKEKTEKESLQEIEENQETVLEEEVIEHDDGTGEQTRKEGGEAVEMRKIEFGAEKGEGKKIMKEKEGEGVYTLESWLETVGEEEEKEEEEKEKNKQRRSEGESAPQRKTMRVQVLHIATSDLLDLLPVLHAKNLLEKKANNSSLSQTKEKKREEEDDDKHKNEEEEEEEEEERKTTQRNTRASLSVSSHSESTTVSESTSSPSSSSFSLEEELGRPPAHPFSNPRLVVHVGRDVNCTLHQTFVNLETLLKDPADRKLLQNFQDTQEASRPPYMRRRGRGGFVNSNTRVFLEQGAELHHVYNQEQSGDSWHWENLSVQMSRNSTYVLRHIDLGAQASRFNLQIEGEESSKHTSLGLSVLNGRQEHSKFEMFHHLKPYAQTNQVMKCLIGNNARSVWRGRIRIEREGVGASAESLDRVILLDEGAKCIAIPTLEIIPDDVIKANHGAMIRDLDIEPLFFLMARGIDELEARKMLMKAYADDVIAPVKDLKLHARVYEKILSMAPKKRKELKRHHMFKGGEHA